MLVHWIWLMHRPGLSDRVKRELMEHFCDAEDLYFADKRAYSHIPGLSREAIESLWDKDLTAAEKILAVCEKERIQILTWRDAAYPARLKNIADPPLVLYYKGQLLDFDANPVIGVVGTRKASAYGLTIAKRMGYQVARCGGMLVSGMAFGIDGMAMQGALTAGGKTVGVLGCGADIVYPVSNRSLFRDVEQYGCILSEFAPGTPPLKRNFPKRNRIISGLSNGVLVVEAPEISGALSTARHAAEQGRDVFVVPGNIDQVSCVGSNALLREGAIAAASGWDVLSEYTALYPGKIRRDLTEPRQRAYPDEVLRAEEESAPKAAQKPRIPRKSGNLKKELDKKGIDKAASAPYSDLNESMPELSPEEQAIMKAIANGERLVDDVIAETGIAPGKLLALLTILELNGRLKRLPGKRITKGKR